MVILQVVDESGVSIPRLPTRRSAVASPPRPSPRQPHELGGPADGGQPLSARVRTRRCGLRSGWGAGPRPRQEQGGARAERPDAGGLRSRGPESPGGPGPADRVLEKRAKGGPGPGPRDRDQDGTEDRVGAQPSKVPQETEPRKTGSWPGLSGMVTV